MVRLNINLGKMEKKIEVREDFIGIFDNFFPENLIEGYLKYFEYCESNNLIYGRDDPARRKDLAINTMGVEIRERYIQYEQKEFVQIFYSQIWPLYVKKFDLFDKISGKHTIYDIKIQKTKPSEGYHIWHAEQSSKKFADRVFAFTLYLNDVEEGGETEFLYQKCRIKPQKNRLVLWPGHLTHTHRGNPPLSGEKYITTGWLEFAE